MSEMTINADVTISGAGASLLANRYRVLRQLGQGGMGSVWLAEDTELDNRQVAIKMLPSILLSNKRAYKQIKSEALVSLKLTHPNIATLRSFEENNGNPFLVIDYIAGQSLDDYLAERGTLTEQETVALLSPIAAALDYAHSRNVIHRDIKPGNVMIAGDGTPYVLDFGIAREMQEVATRVTGKLSSGTLMYMSPEQLHGAAPKAAQDVYSFATMVYECLTGSPPFSRGQIEYQIEHDDPAPLPDGFSIAKMVMSGLAKKPEDRPETCSAILGLAGAKVTLGAFQPQPAAESGAPLRAHSGRQNVAESLRQSAQAILEVDSMLAEVAKFEDYCRDPQVLSSRMAIKSARGEMESASGTRRIELLEAAKAIFAEAKSVYDDHVAKRHFINEISEFISNARGSRDLRDVPEAKDYLREVEQFKVEVEKASAGEWQALQEKFTAIRENAETEICSALKRHREEVEKRRLEEAARREQAELKKRQELEERKRKEEAEIESCKARVESIRQEVRDECRKVFAYVKVHPDYGDCLPIAQDIYASTNEEDPADLSGICERQRKLEKDLERIRSLISSHDVVVCATLNGVEVGRASMLYGERRIDLPVRIKRRHRLIGKEGYLLEYARGNRKYYGWFSPACINPSEGQCAMVPLRNEPSISEISRAYRKRHLMRFLWDVAVALVMSLEASVLVGILAYASSRGNEWAAVVCGIVSVVLEFRSLYCKSMRREMRWAICDDGQYRMYLQSVFNESTLLLDRRERPASELIKKFKLRNWARHIWQFIGSLYFALHIGLLGFFVGILAQGTEVALIFGFCTLLVTFSLLCKRALRREKWGILIGLDSYRTKRVELPTDEEAKESLAEEARVQARKPHRHRFLWVVAGSILVVGGLCLWRYFENVRAEEESRVRQAERQAELKAKAERERAERARREAEARRMEAERARLRAEEKRKAEEAEERRRRESAELDGIRKKIADKVGSGERDALEVGRYLGDPTGFEKHIASIDAAVAKLKKTPVPKDVAEARNVLEAVTVDSETISSELGWLSENMPQREAARRIEEEMKSELDAELVRFEAKVVAAGSYSRGQALRRYGNTALANGDFTLAQKNLAEAKAKLTEALLEAKVMREKKLAKAEAERIAAEKAAAEWKAKLEAERAAKEKAFELLNSQRKSVQNDSARAALPSAGKRPVSVSGRSSVRFTTEDADTLSLLKFSSPVARSYYEKACKLAREGAHNKTKVKSEYDTGRLCGGPEWPELEAWLDWWK